MRIEKDKPILPGWSIVLTEEITGQNHFLLTPALKELGTKDVIINITKGRTYIYKK